MFKHPYPAWAKDGLAHPLMKISGKARRIESIYPLMKQMVAA
jgi:hypothetical protein